MLLVAVLVLCAFAAPVTAQDSAADSSSATVADEPHCVALCSQPDAHIGAMLFDLLVLRTLTGAQMAVGIGAFGVVAPFTFPFGRWDEAWDQFVRDPYEQTFTRKLGDF